MRKQEHIHKNIIEVCKKEKDKSKIEIYQLYSKVMLNIYCRMMDNKEKAEDMLQDAFTQAFVKLDSYHYESNFGDWLK